MEERVERSSLSGDSSDGRGDPGQQLLQRVELRGAPAGARADASRSPSVTSAKDGRIGACLAASVTWQSAEQPIASLTCSWRMLPSGVAARSIGVQRDLAERGAQLAAAHDLVGERDRHAVPVAAQIRPQKLEIERVLAVHIDDARATAGAGRAAGDSDTR